MALSIGPVSSSQTAKIFICQLNTASHFNPLPLACRRGRRSPSRPTQVLILSSSRSNSLHFGCGEITRTALRAEIGTLTRALRRFPIRSTWLHSNLLFSPSTVRLSWSDLPLTGQELPLFVFPEVRPLLFAVQISLICFARLCFSF